MHKSFFASHIVIGTASLLISGCGYMSQVTKDVDYDSVGVGMHRGNLWKYIDEASQPCSTSFLLQKWGEPDERSLQNHGISVWTYHNGLKWIGASPVVLFPLPLFVPAGIEKISFGIKAEQVLFIKHETTNRDFFYFPLGQDSNITVGLYNVSVSALDGCQFKKQFFSKDE